MHQNVTSKSGGIKSDHQPVAELSLGLMLTEAYQGTLVTWHSAFDHIWAKKPFRHYLVSDEIDDEMVSEARENTASL